MLVDHEVHNNSITQYSDLLTEISNEVDKVRPILDLQRAGKEITFAPDFSEIFNFIVPDLDINFDDRDRNLRNYLASIKLMEDRNNRKLLLPPYARELQSALLYFKDYGNRIKKIDILYKLEQLFFDEDFERSFQNITPNFELDEIVSLTREHQKKLDYILSAYQRLQKGVLQLNKLNDEETIVYSNSLVELNSLEVLENSTEWFEYLERVRSPYANTLNKSTMDAWAIEYIQRANGLANEGNEPFVIFVTRSGDIHRVVGDQLSLTISDISNKVDFLWSPDTYLAYFFITRMPRQDHDFINQAVSELKSLQGIELESERANKIEQVFEYWGRPELLTSEIENFISMYDEIENFDFGQSPIKEEQLRVHSLVEQIEEFIQLIVKNSDQLKLILASNIKRVWNKLSFADDLFEEAIGALSVAERIPSIDLIVLDDNEYILLILDSHSIVSKIDDSELKDTLLHQKSLTPDLIDTFNMGHIDGYIASVLAYLFIGDESKAKEVLSLAKFKRFSEKKIEISLLDLSLSFLFEDNLSSAIEFGEMLLSQQEAQDPRLLKILGLLYWKASSKFDRKPNLERSIDLTKSAYELIKGTKNDFELECVNNIAYGRVLLETDLSIQDLQGYIDQLLEIINPIYPGGDFAPEIYHTLGKLRLLLGKKVEDPKDKRELLLLATRNLIIPLAIGDVSVREYEEDFLEAKTALDATPVTD